MWLLLGTQVTSTYTETTGAIETYQSGLDLEEANTNAANVTVAHADVDKKKYEDIQWYKDIYYPWKCQR